MQAIQKVGLWSALWSPLLRASKQVDHVEALFLCSERTENQAMVSNIHTSSEKLRKSLEEIQLPQHYKQWFQRGISKQCFVQLSTLLIWGLLDMLGLKYNCYYPGLNDQICLGILGVKVSVLPETTVWGKVNLICTSTYAQNIKVL